MREDGFWIRKIWCQVRIRFIRVCLVDGDTKLAEGATWIGTGAGRENGASPTVQDLPQRSLDNRALSISPSLHFSFSSQKHSPREPHRNAHIAMYGSLSHNKSHLDLTLPFRIFPQPSLPASLVTPFIFVAIPGQKNGRKSRRLYLRRRVGR